MTSFPDGDLTRKRAEQLQTGLKRVLELLALGCPLDQVLIELACTVDTQHSGISCTILLLSEDGMRLKLAAAPRLPDAYNEAIDGVEIGPNVGSCGSAAYRAERVVVADIANDPLWKDFRDLAIPMNLRACWSQPIFSESREVLGTLAIYHDEPSNPSEAEVGLIEHAAYIAGVAIERARSNQALQESQKELRKLAGKLLHAQEEERRNLARELEDDLSQRLAALAIEAGKLLESPAILPTSIEEGLSRVKDQAVQLSEEVRNKSHLLHPSILDDLGLVDAIASGCELFSRREEIQVDYHHRGVPESLPSDVAVCLCRVAQEGLRNVAKHSGSKHASLSLIGSEEEIVLSITDFGAGFDDERAASNGLGLASMEERVRLVGGNFTVRSQVGEGTTIEVRVIRRS